MQKNGNYCMCTDVLLVQHMEPCEEQVWQYQQPVSFRLVKRNHVERVKSGQSPWLFGGRQEGGGNVSFHVNCWKQVGHRGGFADLWL